MSMYQTDDGRAFQPGELRLLRTRIIQENGLSAREFDALPIYCFDGENERRLETSFQILCTREGPLVMAGPDGLQVYVCAISYDPQHRRLVLDYCLRVRGTILPRSRADGSSHTLENLGTALILFAALLLVGIPIAYCADPRSVPQGIGWLLLACALVVGVPVSWVSLRTQKMRRRVRKGCCVHCGYDLTGNISGVCPECGEKLPRVRVIHPERGTAISKGAQ